jgi:hypothetical protein
VPGGGNNGSNTAHCASVIDEDGYTGHRAGAASWTGHDTHVQEGENDTRTPGQGDGVDNHPPTRSFLKITP